MSPHNHDQDTDLPSKGESSGGTEWGICPKTGLVQRPPPTYPDGRPRYRICKGKWGCRLRKPVTDFQALVRPRHHCPGVYRRGICKSCQDRQKRKRKQRNAARSRVESFDQGTEDIRSVSTSEQIIGICERVAEELPGKDLEGLVRFWVSVIESPKTSHRLRLTSVQTLAHMAVIAAQERLGEESRMDEINPVDFALRLQEQARLVPLIRALLADGVITLDDIDPPPA